MSDLISRSALIAEHCGGCYALASGLCGRDVCGAAQLIAEAPAVDAVEREKLIKKLFPMGVPMTREDWNYAINARAVYEAIMGDLVEPECKTINVKLDRPIEIHSYGDRRDEGCSANEN